VPPPPEKQAVGRFDTNFVESRRAALERMLNKTAAHPTLQHDGDLKLFLESEAFNVDVKHKERKEPGLGESKGMFSSLSISVGTGSKFVEQDEVCHTLTYEEHWLIHLVVPRTPDILRRVGESIESTSQSNGRRSHPAQRHC
jgi:hypothetical protein